MSLFREYVERFAPQNQGESCPARWLATPEEQAKRERELRQAAARVAERRAAFDAAWDAQAEERQRLYDAGDIPGLTALTTPNGSVCFAEARLAMECRKIYWQDLQPEHFLAPDIADNYPQRDYHRMYVGQIAGCYRAK